MEKIRILYDKTGNTLHVWFADPEREAMCEETNEEIVFLKDKDGKVIGFEVLNFLPAGAVVEGDYIPVESQIVAGGV